jgi:hypothetical protein
MKEGKMETLEKQLNYLDTIKQWFKVVSARKCHRR